MHRRRLLALGATALGFSGCFGISTDEPTPTEPRNRTPLATATPESTPSTRIGGSLHGRPFRIDDKLDLIEKSEAQWMHAFLDVRGKYERNADPPTDPDVVALRRIKRETDANLFVTLMWNFTGMFERLSETPLPTAGSADERDLHEFAIELLHAIDEPVDIVALGNEPIHEAIYDDVVGDDSNLIAFTRTLKDHLVEHYTGDPLLLAGAFNRLYDTTVRRAYRTFNHQLFDFARSDDDIDGIDLHIHYSTFEQAEDMVAIARQQFPDGIITATEFSPVWRYYRNTRLPITSFDGGEAFVNRYGIESDTTSAEYLEAAKHDPIAHDEMADYMETMPWYNVNFIEDMYALLNEYDVTIGTFGFLVEDDVRQLDWTDDWYPFPINCLFQPVIVDTDDGAHPHYLDDFRNRA